MLVSLGMNPSTLVYTLSTTGYNTNLISSVGYYVHTCQKVKYKAEYPSSYILDPVRFVDGHPTTQVHINYQQEDWTWWPVEVCHKLLDDMHYACFSHPEHSLQAPPKKGMNFIPSA